MFKMLAVLSFGTILTGQAAQSRPPAGPSPIVSTAWLQQHLSDQDVRVISTDDHEAYDRAHIQGAQRIDHMATLGDGHRLLPPAALAEAFRKAGAKVGARIVLYGDDPMTTGWMFMALSSIGHAADVSLLDGNMRLWQSEKRPTSTTVPPLRSDALSVRPAPDVSVDGAWVRSHLESPDVRLLDVRTADEWKDGHLPGATLILWPDLYADRRLGKFKSLDEIRALLTKAGVGANQQIVTYCAVGMRASLMYWAARAVGTPARVYVGSWQDWRRESSNPIVR
jgi:thiosulfate/3-mercaptopyruvate sulfurtransferase